MGDGRVQGCPGGDREGNGVGDLVVGEMGHGVHGGGLAQEEGALGKWDSDMTLCLQRGQREGAAGRGGLSLLDGTRGSAWGDLQ